MLALSLIKGIGLRVIKPDLHDDYMHQCSSSIPNTDYLLGNDLPKQVKDLTAVNCWKEGEHIVVDHLPDHMLYCLMTVMKDD